jgi:hypothetical protein
MEDGLLSPWETAFLHRERFHPPRSRGKEACLPSFSPKTKIEGLSLGALRSKKLGNAFVLLYYQTWFKNEKK